MNMDIEHALQGIAEAAPAGNAPVRWWLGALVIASSLAALLRELA